MGAYMLTGEFAQISSSDEPQENMCKHFTDKDVFQKLKDWSVARC